MVDEMIAYLIDPKLRRIISISIPDDDRRALDAMRKLIGCTGMDHATLSDQGDTLWCDEFALARGDPVWAFKFKNGPREAGPFGGRCIILGADRYGETAPPNIPIAVIENDCDWLGEIIPELTVVTEQKTLPNGKQINVIRTIVTYSRPK